MGLGFIQIEKVQAVSFDRVVTLFFSGFAFTICIFGLEGLGLRV